MYTQYEQGLFRSCNKKGENMRMSLGTMCRLFLAQMVLTMLFALPLSNANAQYYGGGYGQGGYGQSQPDILRAQINRRVRGQTIIAVKQEVNLATNVRLQGLKALKVIMKASSSQGYGSAQLLINGMRVGYAQTVSRYEDRLVFDLPAYAQNII
jgi:hypothetical protein